jgi:large subunit ribosomal protein L15
VILSSGLIKNLKDGVRILGRGKITSKVSILAEGASKTAVEKVKKVGGNLDIIKNNKLKVN